MICLGLAGLFVASALFMMLWIKLLFLLAALFIAGIWVFIFSTLFQSYANMHAIIHGIYIFSEDVLENPDKKMIELQIGAAQRRLSSLTDGYMDLPRFRKVTNGYYLFLLEELDEASFEAAYSLTFHDLYRYTNGKFIIGYKSRERGIEVQESVTKAITRALVEDINVDAQVRKSLRLGI